MATPLCYTVIIPFFIALFLVGWIHPKLVKIALLKNIVDNPDARKLQRTPVPVLGGVAVFFGVVIAIGCMSAVVDWLRTARRNHGHDGHALYRHDGRHPEPLSFPAAPDRDRRRAAADFCRRLLHKRLPRFVGHRADLFVVCRAPDCFCHRGYNQRHQPGGRRERSLFGLLHHGLHHLRGTFPSRRQRGDDDSGRRLGRGLDSLLPAQWFSVKPQRCSSATAGRWSWAPSCPSS